MENEIDDKHESIVRKINRYKEEGLKYRKQFEQDWREQEDFYEGIQFKFRDPANRPRNYVFQVVESEIPLLMDPMPSTDIIPHEEVDADKATVLQAAKDHVLRQQSAFLKDTIAVRSALKVGQGFEYIGFDEDGENGEGSILIKNPTWDQVVIDPSADEINEARYAIIETPLASMDLKRKYPKTAQEALDNPVKDIFSGSANKYAREDRNNGSNTTGYTANRYESKDMTYIEECWLKDYSMEPIDDDETQIQLTEESAQLMQGINPDITKWEDHEKHIAGHMEQKMIIAMEAMSMMNAQQGIDGTMIPGQSDPSMITPEFMDQLKQDPEIGLLLQIIDDHIEMHQQYIDNMDSDEVGKKPKYPNNLRLVIKTGDVVHYDGAPDVDDGMIPLVFFYCYKNLKIYAEGVVKNIIPLQKTINELDAKELKGLKLVTNPGWIKDLQSGVDEDTLTDEDGLVVTKNQGTEVQRFPAGQVSPQLEQRVRREYESMQRIEGVGETMLGEVPKHAVAATSIRRMQMQSLGRIRLKSRMIELAIERRDRLILSRIIKYWSTERKLRIEDAGGKIKFVKYDPKMFKDLSYDLALAPGTMAGMDNESIYETYKELLIAGSIDLKTFLSVVNLPKKQAILDMLEANDQTAAQVQQLQTENIQMKAQFMPEALTPEEQQLIASQAPQQ